MDVRFVETRGYGICEIQQIVGNFVMYKNDKDTVVIDTSDGLNLLRDKETDSDILGYATKETHAELYL